MADLRKDVDHDSQLDERLAGLNDIVGPYPKISAVVDGGRFLGIRMHRLEKDHPMLKKMGYRTLELIKSINGRRPGPETYDDIRNLIMGKVEGYRLVVFRDGKNVELKA